MRLQGRRALIVGFGRSGRASAAFLGRRGAQVRVVDRADTPELRAAVAAAGLQARLGGYGEDDLEDQDLIVVSPGVSWDETLLEAARRRGIEVSSEIDLFLRLCQSPVIGITGTNGKTTTTALAADLLRAGGQAVVRGGNIGEPVLDRMDQLTGKEWVVLELSSFQLESIAEPRLRIGTVLNITPDHLDRHKTMAAYADIKAKAVEFLGPQDHAVLNFDDPLCSALGGRTQATLWPFSIGAATGSRGMTVQEGWITCFAAAGPVRVMPVGDIPLPGAHNLSNVLAAVGIAQAANVALDAAAEGVRGFRGVEHRLELIGVFRGVRWYNDSKATNPDSTLKALGAFADPMVLIAGGRNKGLDIDPLARAIATRVQTLVAIGETREQLAARTRAHGLRSVCVVPDLQHAVRQAAAAAAPGSVVVLSPGFASYDMFADFEDRGRRFKAAVLSEVGP